MKQLLKMLTALTLSIMLVLTSFAAPAMVGTVDSASEKADVAAADESAADLAADVVIEGTEEVVLKEYTFDTDAEGWTATNNGDVADGGVKTLTGDDDGVGVFWLGTDVDGYKDWRMNISKLSYDTSTITKIQVRVKAPYATALKMHWVANGMTKVDGNIVVKKDEIQSSSWQTIEFVPDESWVNWSGTLTHIRLAFSGDGVATHEVYVDSIKIYGYETEKYDFLPGYNLLTGTKEALDFDDLTSLGGVLSTDCSYGTLVPSIADSPISGGTGKALKLGSITSSGNDRTTMHPIVKFGGIHKKPSDGRKYLIKLNTAVTNTDSYFKQALLRYGRDNGTTNFKQLIITKTSASSTIDNWMSHYVVDDVSTSNLATVFFTVDFNQTISEKTAMGFEIWLDDIMYIPYYKVTYMDGDTKLGEAFVLDDGNGNILDSFNPADYDDAIQMPANKNAWSLTDGGEEVTSIALDGKDIVVYATNKYSNKIIACFEFDDESDLAYWNFTKSNDPVLEEGVLEFTSEADTIDTIMQIKANNVISFETESISRIEMRVKLLVDGKPADADTTVCEFHYRLNGSGDWAGNIATEKYSKYIPDDEGFYTFMWETEKLTTWNGNLTYIRFDPHGNKNGTAYVDYIRFYGYNDKEPVSGAPEKIVEGGLSLRMPDASTNNSTGVRFKAAMGNDVKAKYNTALKDGGDHDYKKPLTEYGWIVALADTLGGREFTHKTDVKYVTGISCGYDDKDEKWVDRIYSTEDDKVFFTAVIIGIPVEQAARQLVVRPYSKIAGAYVYGESWVISPKEVAEKIYQDYCDKISNGENVDSHTYNTHKDYIDSLIAINA